MWRHVVALSLAALVIFTNNAGAQTQDASVAFPQFDVPRELRSYTDEATLMNSARTVLALLKSAKFENNAGSYTSGGKAYDYDYSLKADCDTPEIRAFYRGLHLAHMAYNLFLSKQEVGWPEDKGAVEEFPHTTRHFASSARSLLFRYWSAAKLGGFAITTLTLLDLGDERKADLVAFLTRLREYRGHHAQLNKVRDQVDRLFVREDPAAFYGSLSDKSAPNIPSAEKRLTYMELAKELRELINRTREPGVPAVSECFVSEAPFRLTLGADSQIESVRLFTPIKYMVSFWRRRAAEGTEEFADFSIGRVIAALGGDPQSALSGQ
jgi:hypothetical protein